MTGSPLVIDCELRRLCGSRDFDDDELDAVRDFKVGDIAFEAGADIMVLQSESAHLWTLYSGVASRYVLLKDGRRQILNILFPGEFRADQRIAFLDDGLIEIGNGRLDILRWDAFRERAVITPRTRLPLRFI